MRRATSSSTTASARGCRRHRARRRRAPPGAGASAGARRALSAAPRHGPGGHDLVRRPGRRGLRRHRRGRRLRARRAPRRRRRAAATVEEPLERVSRRSLWRAALLAWRDHPLLGLGPDNSAAPTTVTSASTIPTSACTRTISISRSSPASASPASRRWGGHRRVRARRACGPPTPRRRVTRRPDRGRRRRRTGRVLVHGFFDYFLEFTPTYGLLWLLGGIVAGLAAREPARAAE